MQFYRFRTLDNLLGKRKELENQEIYFASPEQQNDPMEGYHDIYFQGDEIVWTNFFKNYLFLLNEAFTHKITQDSQSEFKEPNHIDLFYEWGKLLKIEKEYLQSIFDNFLLRSEIQNLITELSIAHRKFSLHEIEFYLKSIHPLAINSLGIKISDINSIFNNQLNKNYFLSLDTFRDHKNINLLFQNLQLLNEQQILLFKSTTHLKQEDLFYHIEFPRFFVKKLMNLIYQNWYSACFMNKESSTSSSVWGSYGSNHTGICLIFNSEIKNDSLTLELYTPEFSNKSNTYEQRLTPLKFHRVEYDKEPNSFNFFTSLGRINRLELDRNWLINFKGETSYLRSEIYQNYDVWHENHHDTFIKNITRKSKDWRYENEYRLILNEFCYDYSNPKNRTLRYEFSSLHGLIFGVNTPEKDKLKIIKLIYKKCKEHKRTDFKFYQAYFCHSSQSVQHMPLDLIKFKV